MKKTNIIIIILAILVLVLTGYIVYNKVLKTEEKNYQDNNDSNNSLNEENTNNNINNSNDNTNQNELTEIIEMDTIKEYVGCSKNSYQTEQVYFEYATYKLQIKENGNCVLCIGGVDSASHGCYNNVGTCVIDNSYIIYRPFSYQNNIYQYFKINSDNQITYQNANVVMNEIESTNNLDYYNYCKNNH